MPSDEELEAAARETMLHLTALLIGLDEVLVQSRDGAMFGWSPGEVARMNQERDARRRARFLKETRDRRNLD